MYIYIYIYIHIHIHIGCTRYIRVCVWMCIYIYVLYAIQTLATGLDRVSICVVYLFAHLLDEPEEDVGQDSTVYMYMYKNMYI